MSKVFTYSGKMLDLSDIRPEAIDIKDIAHALSQLCRFSGQCRSFYSVAEHSIRVCGLVPDEHKLAALLHDASEAYLGDVIAPIKQMLPAYKKLEDELMAVIANKFGFQWPLPAVVKEADRKMLDQELDTVFSTPLINGMQISPHMIKLEFLSIYYKLKKTHEQQEKNA